MPINIATLLEPIPGGIDSGEDLRIDSSQHSDYYTLKDFRNSARAIERKNAQGDTSQSAEKIWQQVYDLSIKLLETKSKDLEVAMWLTESAIRLEALSGLTNSFSLIAGLITRYWDTLFPMPDEDGILTRIAPLFGLNGEDREGTLIPPIRSLDITEGESFGPYKLWQYQQCIEVEKISNEALKAERYKNQQIPKLSDLKKAALETPLVYYKNLTTAVNNTIKEYESINIALAQFCEPDQLPPTTYIMSSLQSFKDHISYILCLTDRTIEESELIDPLTPEQIDETPIAQAKVPDTSKNQTTMNRSNAINTLKDISDFFKESEPHSPIPFLLDRAVRWSNLSFDVLLGEIIADQNTRLDVEKLTGIEIAKTDS